jgi:hypothetical protein
MVKDNEHALSDLDRKLLYAEFFTIREIREFDNMHTPDGMIQEVDIRSPLWQAVRARRLSAANRLRNQGFADSAVRKQFDTYFRQKTGGKPFDFLKTEYKPKKKVRDYQATMKETRKRIEKTFGKSYFKNEDVRYQPVRRARQK